MFLDLIVQVTKKLTLLYFSLNILRRFAVTHLEVFSGSVAAFIE